MAATVDGAAMSRTFVVTGCAGFIGSHLTEALLLRGDEVVGVDSFADCYPRRLKERNLEQARSAAAFSLVEADLATADVGDAVAGSEGVFHLAAHPGVRGSWGEPFAAYVRDNVLASQRVLEAAATAGKRVVFASSSSIYGNAETYPTGEDLRPAPISPYAVTKLACEQLAGAYRESRGLDFVALRYFTVYGPRQRPDMAFSRVIDALLEGGTFRVFGSGRQSRDVTYVGDAVGATLAAMDAAASGCVFNVGGGSETTLSEAIAVLESLAGRPLATELVEDAPGDVRRTAADISRARDELGWRPRVALEKGLALQLAWASRRAAVTV